MSALIVAPANSTKVTCKVSGAYVFLFPHPTLPAVCARAYTKHSRSKPVFSYRYTKPEQRERTVREFFAAQRKAAEYEAARNAPHSLKAGDILVNTWGYEQTNVDFYQVSRTTTKGVYLRPVSSSKVADTGWEQGKVMPVIGGFTGPEFFKRATASGVSMAHGGCSKWDGTPQSYTSYY